MTGGEDKIHPLFSGISISIITSVILSAAPRSGVSEESRRKSAANAAPYRLYRATKVALVCLDLSLTPLTRSCVQDDGGNDTYLL